MCLEYTDEMYSLTFDDQIEPSEVGDALEQEQAPHTPVSLHAEEKGSNAAQSGVGVSQGAVEPVASQSDTAMADAKAEGAAGRDIMSAANDTDRDNREAIATAPKRRHAGTNLPMVQLEPSKWEKKSEAGARRARRRLRRLLREEQALISSQLLVA